MEAAVDPNAVSSNGAGSNAASSRKASANMNGRMSDAVQTDNSLTQNAAVQDGAETQNSAAQDSEPKVEPESKRPALRGVHVSPGAVEYAKKRLLQRGTPNAAIRLGIRGGGCSGFQYVIEFSDDPPRSRDTVTTFDGVTFYVDKKSLLYLGGSTLDYVKTLMYQGFKFLNPQEATSCGCGHSFTVK